MSLENFIHWFLVSLQVPVPMAFLHRPSNKKRAHNDSCHGQLWPIPPLNSSQRPSISIKQHPGATGNGTISPLSTFLHPQTPQYSNLWVKSCSIFQRQMPWWPWWTTTPVANTMHCPVTLSLCNLHQMQLLHSCAKDDSKFYGIDGNKPLMMLMTTLINHWCPPAHHQPWSPQPTPYTPWLHCS